MKRVAFALLLVFSVSAVGADDARRAVHFELGGNGVIPTINYEQQLRGPWWGRAGASFVTSSTSSDSDTKTTFVVPVTVSRISHAASNHHFEIGGGLTVAFGDRQDLYDSVDNHETFSSVIATGILGYRYQKPGGGFQFRSALTPLIGAGDVYPWFGVSFGYAW